VAFRSSIYKSAAELKLMVRPGLITAAALDAVRAAIAPGVTTLELDAIAERVIREAGAEPNFMLVPGYRHTICASVNEEVVHGIPGPRVLQPGDIVSIDCGAQLDGWNGDSAFSVVVPDPSRPELVAERERLVDVTERSLWHGIEDYTGHGIGRSMHEEPPVFNFRVREKGPEVKVGLAVAIEPMLTAGSVDTVTLADDWTVVTEDASMAAHWEHSVAVHAGGIWVLTAPDGGAAGLAPLGVTPVPIA
jgi:methionyl aminopeptidase